MKRTIAIGISLAMLVSSPASRATNLVEAFQAALKSDPTYKQAEAQYTSDKSQIDIARAGVMPSLGLIASMDRSNSRTGYTSSIDNGYPGYSGTNGQNSFDERGYTLTLTQPIFDFQAFKQIAQAKASVQASAATYAAAGQTIIVRLAQAYFNVLEAQDILRYSEAQQKSLYRQYQVSRQRYNVGLDAITSLYKSQAAYDAAKAEYLSDENNLSNARESLREITGNYYPDLKTLENNFPLVSPSPMNINQWVKTALEQNLSLRAARFNVMAAQEAIKAAAAGNMPTLDANASIQDAYSRSRNQGEQGVKNVRSGELGVALDFPVYDGGLTNGNTEYSEAQYQLAIAQMETQYRATIADTRKAYLSVVSQISQVTADRQSIKSHVAALESIQAGYQAGTQTVLDVLQAQTDLFQAEQSYAQDRFAYLMNTLNLKLSAGILSPNDLESINRWLTATSVAPRTNKTVAAMPVARKQKATKKTTATKQRQATRSNKIQRVTSKKA